MEGEGVSEGGEELCRARPPSRCNLRRRTCRERREREKEGGRNSKQGISSSVVHVQRPIGYTIAIDTEWTRLGSSL